jgi:POT family proton-dependent oligopeptide transporter
MAQTNEPESAPLKSSSSAGNFDGPTLFGHPRPLFVLFFTEMWERFSFYLMIGILYQYLTDSVKGGLGWGGVQASSLVGSYIALVYFTPFLGGLLADRVLGSRKTIVLGGVFMMIGHTVLAFPQVTALYLGLLFLIIGNGFFKPNISTLVGNLYPPGSPLKDTGYNIFYMGINVGAFICTFIAAIVRNKFDQNPEWGVIGWHAAFATAGIGMLFGLVIFLANYKTFARYENDPKAPGAPRESLRPLWVECLGPAAVTAIAGFYVGQWLWSGAPAETQRANSITMAFLFACLPVFFFYGRILRNLKSPAEKQRVAALYTIFVVVIVFWGIFHQNTTALNDWAIRSTDRSPNAIVQPIVELAPDFAEVAPLDYYYNAAPSVPRPPKDRYIVVSLEEYDRLKEDKALATDDGRLHVTQPQFDRIYRYPESPMLPPGAEPKLVNAELFQSINAGMVLLFTPFVIVPFFAFMKRRKREPSTPAKIALGLLLTAGGPLVMLFAVLATNDADPKASSWWLFGTYAFVTLGELCLSPMGLSLVSKTSPARLRAFMMGGWFLSTAIGNKFAGVFGEVYHEWDHVTFFIVTMSCMLAAALLLYMLLPWLRRQFASAESF